MALASKGEVSYMLATMDSFGPWVDWCREQSVDPIVLGNRHTSAHGRFGFIAYLLVFVGLYAVFGELQWPRHRVQLDYAGAILQFIGVMAVLKRAQLGSSLKRVATAT